MHKKGTLEVLLLCAKRLESTDFLTNMDPYVTLIYRTQEQRSSTAQGKGCDPEWNETFVFSISTSFDELVLKIMDSDTVMSDDFVGQAVIDLKPIFHEGHISPTSYNVVKDDKYCGEIRLSLTFTPEINNSRKYEEESYGGWRESGH